MKTKKFKKFKKADFIAIAILVILWSIITYFINIPDTQSSFMLILLITSMFMVFIALFIGKPGSVILFLLIGSIFTLPINNFGGFGLDKILILGVIGLVFEILLFLLKIEIKNIPFDMILAAAISLATVPFSMLLILGGSRELMYYVWNFSLISFIIGVIGSIIIFMVWYNIKGLKPVIKFEYRI